MPATPVLAVTNDSTFPGLLRSKLPSESGRIVVAPSLDEACSLLKTARPRLIVVHLSGDVGRYEQFDRLLWATSVLSRPTPVLVIAERYLTEQATTLYRMGVAEYISRTHHLDQLGDVLAVYVRPVNGKASAATADGANARSWGGNHTPPKVTAQVV
jgi:DNA-binding response OmpR family regulator